MYVHVWVHPVKGIPHHSTPLGLTLDNAEQHVKLAGDIARFEIQNNLLLQPHYLNSHKSHKCSSPIWFADLATDRQESEHPVRVKLKDQKMPVDVDRGFSAACNKCRVSFESSAAEGFIKKARTVLEFQWFPCSVLQMDFIQASLQVQMLDKSQWNEGLPWIYQNSVQDKDSGLASRKSEMKIQWKHFTVSLIFCFCMQAVEIGLASDTAKSKCWAFEGGMRPKISSAKLSVSKLKPLSIYFVWVLQSENSLDIMPSWKKVASITHPCCSLQITSCLVTWLKRRDSCMVVVWLGLSSVRSWLYFLALSLSLLKSYAWQSVDRETCTF